MAVQNTIYLTDGTTRTFPSTKHIATIQHVGVWVKRTSDSVWVVVSTSDYTLVQNAIIFDTAPDSVLYSHVEVRVADDASELTTSPSDITLVAGSIANVDIVATNINSVNTNTTNIGAINTVSGSIGVVTTVATNIANVNSIATTVVPNMAEILLADDNAAIATTQAGIATSAANSATATLNEFKGIFLGTFTAHPLVADVGDMYFNSATNVLYFKGTTTWIPSINPTSSTTTETLIPITTLGQTLSIGYTVGLVEVYLNGIRLTNGDDFVATDGLAISLAIGASYQWDVGDSVLVVSYDVDTRSLYTAPEVDALLALKAPITSPLFVTQTSSPLVLANTTSVLVDANKFKMQSSGGIYTNDVVSTPSIEFTNTGVAGITSLDYYLEDTFIPVVQGVSVTGTGTYGTRTGKFTRIGNVVHFSLNITVTAHTGSGSMIITGLPYVSATSSAVSISSSSLLGTAGEVITGYVPTTTSYVALYSSSVDGTAYANIPIDTAFTIFISGIYFV